MSHSAGPVQAYAPASIGNVSLGFDLLGAALKPLDGSVLGDTVSVQPAARFSLEVAGRFAHKLPADSATNIVTQAYEYFIQQLKQQGKPTDTLALTLDKHLPIGSGLGSSASSVVAAFVALNAYFDQPFDNQQLLLMMGELEGRISGAVHYDNVAPCFLGGLTLMVEQPGQITTSLPVFDDWYWVVCYSGLSVSTAAARKILPKQIGIADTLTFGRQLAVFVDALHRGDRQLAAAMMQDVIAEPYRKSLLPGFDAARDFVMANGGLSFGISGSGPTVFAVTPDLDNAQRIEHFLQQHYIGNDDGFSHICRIDTQGAHVTEGDQIGII